MFYAAISDTEALTTLGSTNHAWAHCLAAGAAIVLNLPRTPEIVFYKRADAGRMGRPGVFASDTAEAGHFHGTDPQRIWINAEQSEEELFRTIPHEVMHLRQYHSASTQLRMKMRQGTQEYETWEREAEAFEQEMLERAFPTRSYRPAPRREQVSAPADLVASVKALREAWTNS